MEEVWSLDTKRALVYLSHANDEAMNLAVKLAVALAAKQCRVTILAGCGSDPAIKGRLGSAKGVDVEEIAMLPSRPDLQEFVETKGAGVDILINVALCKTAQREATEDNKEKTWSLNVDAPLILTHSLLSRLAKNPPGVVLNIGSGQAEEWVMEDDTTFNNFSSDDAVLTTHGALAHYTEYCTRHYGQTPSRQLHFYMMSVEGIPGYPTSDGDHPSVQQSVDDITAFLSDRANFAGQIAPVITPAGKPVDNLSNVFVSNSEEKQQETLDAQNRMVAEWMSSIGGLSEDPLAISDDGDIFSALFCCAGGR